MASESKFLKFDPSQIDFLRNFEGLASNALQSFDSQAAEGFKKQSLGVAEQLMRMGISPESGVFGAALGELGSQQQRQRGDLLRDLSSQFLSQRQSELARQRGEFESDRAFKAQSDQFSKQFGESQRQFDVGAGQFQQQFGEGQRQFGLTFGEGQRQFDTGQTNFLRSFDENQRQFDQSQRASKEALDAQLYNQRVLQSQQNLQSARDRRSQSYGALGGALGSLGSSLLTGGTSELDKLLKSWVVNNGRV